MMFRSAMNLRNSLVLLGALALGACASSDPSELAFEEVPAEKLYAQGLTAMDSGDDSLARKKFEELDRQHPYSNFARRSIFLNHQV